ncbi:MAG: hypothetical protein ACRDEA_17850, partial [Microcystaceae cyanobacterium]
MDNPDVVVDNAGFYNLGRTDKSKPIDDVGTNIDGSAGGGTNIRGRYPLHLHRTGVADINGTSAEIKGNAVFGSPGWGITHHESNADIENNVVFDVVGAGFMSESGTELGAWRNNIAIKTKDGTPGNFNPADFDRQLNYDMGFEGDGFWVQGAGPGLEITDNIAISNSGAGIDFHNVRHAVAREKAEPGAAHFAVKNLTPQLQSELSQLGLTEVDIAVLPIRKFSGFVTYNSYGVLNFYGVSRNEDGQGSSSNPQNYQLAINERSRLQNFQGWNLYGTGITEAYTDNIDFVNGLIAGNTTSPYKYYGVYGNSASINHLYKNIRVEGFPTGFRVPAESLATPYGSATLSTPIASSRLEDSFLANGTNFSSFVSRLWSGADNYRYP